MSPDLGGNSTWPSFSPGGTHPYLLLADIQSSNVTLTLQILSIGPVILSYEWALTFSEEVRCVWKRKVSGVSVTFILMRYSALLYSVLVLVQHAVSGPQNRIVCETLGHVAVYVEGLVYLGLSIFCTLRVYAILGRNIKVAILVFLLFGMYIGVNTYVENKGAVFPMPMPQYACTQPRLGSLEIALDYMGMGSALIGESIVQAVTWKRTFRTKRMLREQNMNQRLGSLLLRDGTALFTVIFIWALGSQFLFGGILTYLTPAVLSICVCRFVLLLRETYLPEEFGTTGISNVASRIVGNMGAPISMVQLQAAYPNDSGDTEEHELRDVHVSNNPLGSPRLYCP